MAITTGVMPAESPPIAWPDAAPVALPTCSAPSIPQGPCPVCPRLEKEFEPWRQAAYWQAMHQRAVLREKLLHDENQQLHARIRYLEQQLFGRKADTTATDEGSPRSERTPRPRGQQPGKP